MKNKLVVGVFVLLCAFESQTYANKTKTNYTKFDHLTVKNGLSSNRIWCMLRDRKDYLWMSTDVGLDKFDSYEVKKYRFNKSDPNSISSNNILTICEDHENNLWFGTSNGLDLYDPAKDNFKVFHYNADDKNSLNGNIVNSIVEDKKGNIWIVTDGNCLNKWVKETQSFIRYPFEIKIEGLTNRHSRMIAEDSKGDLWLVSLVGGIHRFETKTTKFTKYNDPSIDFGNNCFKSLLIDNQDKIWITSDGSGFFSYDPQSGKFEQFNSKGDGKGTNQKTILDIMQEDDQHLLLGVDQGGINRFDKYSKTFEYILYDKANEDGLNNDGIWCFYNDREGILWVGTSGGGINYLNPKKGKFKLFTHQADNPQSLSYNFTGCFYEDHQGMIWIGTDGGGVNVYDPKTGKFKVYSHNPSDRFSISGNVIRCIAEDKNDDIWIATWGAGLNKFERKTGRFFHYMPDKNNPSSITGESIWNLTIDHNDIIWLAGYRFGIDLFDKNKGVIKRFRNNTENQNGVSSNQSLLFHEDSEQNMWICTQNGLDFYNSKTKLFKVFNFPENEIRALCIDKDGKFWVGTSSKGIFYCEPDGTIIKNYDTTNGLPNDIIQAIIEDNHGNFWISTAYGISHFDRKKQLFRNYSKEDGLQGDQFFQQSFLKTHNGTIYFGGYNGFNSFHPDSLNDNDFVPPIYITDFQIFNKPVNYGVPGSQFQTQISEAKEITLKWQQSVFSFSFAAINYTNPEKNQYAYMMEGFEKEWNYTNASRRYITYTNLDPGKYTLHIKASNNDGLWNGKGVSLKIIILPPWWKALWFKAIVFIVIIIVLIIIYYIRLEMYRKREIELSELVEKRTDEITHANNILLERQTRIEEQSVELLAQTENLKEANEQLIQKQSLIKSQSDTIQEANTKLTKLNSTKDRILSIIGHDLRNPFNVVSGFSELLLADYGNLPPDTIKMYLNYISNSSKNGNTLLGNLLQWSKTQTGNISFDPTNLNLLLMAKETSNFLEGATHKKNINIQLQIDPALDIVADENMLKTILRNLLSNAIKFTHENGTITIHSSKKNDYVEICVSDSGVGIPEEKIPLLFRIETNASTKGTSQESGSGLGLILCREFVEKHHGKIWVETKLGVGSQFKFTLPL